MTDRLAATTARRAAVSRSIAVGERGREGPVEPVAGAGRVHRRHARRADVHAARRRAARAPPPPTRARRGSRPGARPRPRSVEQRPGRRDRLLPHAHGAAGPAGVVGDQPGELAAVGRHDVGEREHRPVEAVGRRRVEDRRGAAGSRPRRSASRAAAVGISWVTRTASPGRGLQPARARRGRGPRVRLAFAPGRDRDRVLAAVVDEDQRHPGRAAVEASASASVPTPSPSSAARAARTELVVAQRRRRAAPRRRGAPPPRPGCRPCRRGTG